MDISQNSPSEHPGTYVVQDSSNQEELTRLTLQDESTTAAMGGVLPEQQDPTLFQQILDVACGTGGWLIQAAQNYPSMQLLVGVDVSSSMIAYARAHANVAHVQKRVEFHTMNALQMLEFPADFFDLVNQRLGTGYLRTWDWAHLLQEFWRVTRPGGVIRLTEGDMVVESSSPALTHLFDFALRALSQAGHFFTPESKGVSGELVRLLRQLGCERVQTRPYLMETRAGTPEGEHLAKNMTHLFRTLWPFMQKWSQTPDDYETMYQQMLREIQHPDFVATGNLLTAWGYKPG